MAALIPDLSIPSDKVCFIITKAREFDAKDVVTDPDDASNPTDDAMVSVLEDHPDDPVVEEIAAVIRAMSIDEQVDLVTLVWLGRGDGTLDDWDELRAEAARVHNNRTRAICSASRSSPTIWRKRSRNSKSRATRSERNSERQQRHSERDEHRSERFLRQFAGR